MTQFLYQELDTVAKYGVLNQWQEMPACIKNNINPKFEIRKYQQEGFARFFHCYKTEYTDKKRPLHLLFNMATGSGKTLMMAGLILYLYQEGYRNFLFFVNSTNIIEKTKDNFLNSSSGKYLFNQSINIDNKLIKINAVENFQGANEHDINICFTTIQQLHSDLNTIKEGALTPADFEKYKTVLLADEAHHMSTATRRQQTLDNMPSWENTVQSVFETNINNLLLEFTATHDYANAEMVEKYRNKVLYRYDLPQFRLDKFSKEVMLISSDFDLDNRILQALILSQYKQEVAAKHRINLKPVILFKANATIAQSAENKENFHKLVDSLTAEKVANIRSSNIPIVQSAFKFFAENNINDGQLAERIKRDFALERCLSVNDETETNKYQITVNTLEDNDNHVRAIFAVNKLNEGWDVLNLFDIVRCYETRDSGHSRLGKTTVSEAQLVGRGARLFPFISEGKTQRYQRKYDDEKTNELRVIEELHYHSINDSHYISEIRSALVNVGMMDDETTRREIRLKDPFIESNFYKNGYIYGNERIPRGYQNINSFADLKVKRKNITFKLFSGKGREFAVLDGEKQDEQSSRLVVNQKDIAVKDIEKNIVYSAISRCPFYEFQNLVKIFPHIESIDNFINADDYLGGLGITFSGNGRDLAISKKEKLLAVLALLNTLEGEIKQEITEYEGQRQFSGKYIHQYIKNKSLNFSPNNERLKEDREVENIITNSKWFVFDRMYGTSEERKLIKLMQRRIAELEPLYQTIYLIRNEGQFTIYNFADGRAFQPDFILFAQEKNGNEITYQVFIEPKGAFLQKEDEWKQVFLKEITEIYGHKLLEVAITGKYRIFGVPFYNENDENKFIEEVNKVFVK